MIYKTFNNTIKKAGEYDEVIRASAEAKICLNCTLSAKKCHPLSCKRYKEESRRIKEQK